MNDDWFLTDWSLLDFGEAKVASDKKAQLVVVETKGDCPKCGKHIGRGIHNHVKACEPEVR